VSAHQVREALSRQVADIRASLARNPRTPWDTVEMDNLLLDVGDFYGAVSAYLQAARSIAAKTAITWCSSCWKGVLDICPESLSAAKELIRISTPSAAAGRPGPSTGLRWRTFSTEATTRPWRPFRTALEVDPGFHDAGT
jgi:hypothetical protein